MKGSKRIDELEPAVQINEDDSFIVQQSEATRKLTGNQINSHIQMVANKTVNPLLVLSKATGEGVVTINGAADYPLQSLVITGETRRDGTPEPDNPVHPVSLGDSGTINIKVCGANMLDWQSARHANNWANDGGVNHYIPITGFVVGKDYTICCDSIPTQTVPIGLCVARASVWPSAVGWIYNNSHPEWGSNLRTWTATQEVYYLSGYFADLSILPTMVDDWLPNLRIYQGNYTADTIPPYEPYKGQTVTIPAERPIMRIGSAADRVDFTTGKIVRAIQELSIGESAAWYDFKTYDTGYCTVAVEMPTLKGSNGFTGTLCNYFIEGGRGAVVNRPPVADGFALIPSGNHARLHVALAQSNLSDVSLDGFKAWLSSHPMKIWAEAVDLTEEQIEPAALRSYDGTTTIAAYGAPGEPFPGIESTAVQNINLVLKELKQAIIAGGAT